MIHRIFFHGADNWSMDYRHHKIAFLKPIDDKIQSKKISHTGDRVSVPVENGAGKRKRRRIPSAGYYRPMQGTEPFINPPFKGKTANEWKHTMPCPAGECFLSDSRTIAGIVPGHPFTIASNEPSPTKDPPLKVPPNQVPPFQFPLNIPFRK